MVIHQRSIGAPPRRRAVSLLEVLIAVSIFGLTLLAFMIGLLAVMQMNRRLTQREVATAKAMEILHLVTSLESYSQVSYGTPLKNIGGSAWTIPGDSSTYVPLLTDDYEAATHSFGTSRNKLIDGEWALEINERIGDAGLATQWRYKRVTVRVRWNDSPQGNRHQYVVMTRDLSEFMRY